MKNKELLSKLNRIQYSTYVSSCWLDIIKQYVLSFDNELSNKVELIIDVLIEQNSTIYKEINELWVRILDI